MPLPLLFIGIAAVTGVSGIGKTIKAGVDANEAKKLNEGANQAVQEATDMINRQRKACGTALNELGKEKIFVLNHSMKSFLDSFKKIKNVDFRTSEGLDELSRMHLDQNSFEDMEKMVQFAGALAGGAAAGTAGGALAAFGAYGAAQALATASTGTAIASLSGAAATNATLAFFGGGSLAAGGLGMAGGAAVLGGLVAGPALLIMGCIAGAAAHKNLEKAQTNSLQAQQAVEQLSAGAKQCELIRRRTYLFYILLARLDSYFLPLIYQMEDILKTEGDDYRNYSSDSRKVIASCASVAVSIKSVLDTAILTDDGLLTTDSETVIEATKENLEKFQKLAGEDTERMI